MSHFLSLSLSPLSTHTYIFTQAHTYIFTYTHIYVHTHTYTHIHLQRNRKRSITPNQPKVGYRHCDCHSKILKHKLSRTMTFSYTTIMLLSHLGKSVLIQYHIPKNLSCKFFPLISKMSFTSNFFPHLGSNQYLHFGFGHYTSLLCLLESSKIPLSPVVSVLDTTKSFEEFRSVVLQRNWHYGLVWCWDSGPSRPGKTHHHMGDIVYRCTVSHPKAVPAWAMESCIT